MIHESLASAAASPLIWMPAAGYPVCRRELTSHAQVKSAGPAIPAQAPPLATSPATMPVSVGRLARKNTPGRWRG